VSAVLLQLAERDVKGELTLIVHGATVEFEIAEDQLKAEIGRLITAGTGAKEISELIGGRYGLAKREVYRRVLEIKNLKP
jgi:16S rRNA C1402 (ribose-2'-O) methylase RsmI